MECCTKTEEFKELRKDIDKLFDRSDEIIKLTLLVSQNTEALKEQGKAIQDVSKTMIKMTESLSIQHDTLKELNEEMGNTNKKVDELDKKVDKKGSVNVLDKSGNLWIWLIIIGVLYVISQAPTILQSFIH